MEDYEVLEVLRAGEYDILICSPKAEDYSSLESSLENLSRIYEDYEKNNRSCED